LVLACDATPPQQHFTIDPCPTAGAIASSIAETHSRRFVLPAIASSIAETHSRRLVLPDERMHY